MALKLVEKMLKIEDYCERRAALIAFIRNESNPLVEVLYAGFRMLSQGCYQIYKGMKQYYDSDSREEAESGWEDHCRFERISEEIKEDVNSLIALEDVELMQRLGDRIYPIMGSTVFDALPKGSLAPELRRELAEKIIHYPPPPPPPPPIPTTAEIFAPDGTLLYERRRKPR